MLRHRVIPVLLHNTDGLVKTRNFKDPVYIGDPINAVRIFNLKEVDELIFLDISCTKLGREPNFDLIERITSECFMPLGYGGGIKNIEQAKKLFAIGIEKLIIQAAAIEKPSLISQIANFSGSQSLSISVDVFRDKFGNYKIYQASKRRTSDLNLRSYLKSLENFGAGEIFLTSVNAEGTMAGFDLQLIEEVQSVVRVPLVAHGGARTVEDFAKAISAGANAVAAGSMFVFYQSRKGVLINYPDYDDLELMLGDKSEI